MPNVNIVSVGKIREKYFSQACGEYVKRLSAYCRLTVHEIDEEAIPEGASKKQILAALDREGAKIMKAIAPKSYIISLCIEGGRLSSEEFAKLLERAQSVGSGSVAFIIGGSNGLSESVKNASDFKLSFSEMTFPRQIARLLLLEQLYRGYSIINNGKYHK